jgi:hypothetical protein
VLDAAGLRAPAARRDLQGHDRSRDRPGPRNLGIDLRLREQLPALERLSDPQRDSLVAFLDALTMPHRYAADESSDTIRGLARR